MKSCDNYRDMISSYFDNLITEEEMQDLFSHMKTCIRCNNDFLLYEQLFNELDNIPAVPLPDGFHDDFMQKLNTNKNILFVNFKKVSFAAVCIIAFMFIFNFGNKINTTPIESPNKQVANSSNDIAPNAFILDEGNKTFGSVSDTSSFGDYISNYNITIEMSEPESLIQYINNYNGITVSSNMQYDYFNISKQIPLSDVDNFLIAIKTYGTVTNESINKEKVQSNLLELQAKKDSEDKTKIKLFNYLAQANTVAQITLLESRINVNQTNFNNYDSQITSILEDVNNPVVNINLITKNNDTLKDVNFTTKLSLAFKQSLFTTIHFASRLIIFIANNFIILIVVFIALLVYIKRRNINAKK